jgi:hypothetical protein
MAYDISDLLANLTSQPLDPTALGAAGWTPPYGLLNGDLTSGQQPNFGGQTAQALSGLLGPTPYGAPPPPAASPAAASPLPQSPQPPQQAAALTPEPSGAPQQGASPPSGRDGLLGYVGGSLHALGGLLGIGNTQSQQPQPQPQGQPTGAPQQPSFVRKIGDVLMLPLNVLAAESEDYAATPSNIALARQMRQTALAQAQLDLQRQRSLTNASTGLLGLLGDDGSGGGQTQSAPSSVPGPQAGPPPPTPSPQGSGSALQSQGAPQGPQTAPPGAPRGLRNMNPGNVRALPNGQAWQGQTGTDDQGYAQFGAMQDGIRAALVNLHNYGQLHGINTVSDVINRWSPDAPVSYAQSVAKIVGVGPNDKIDLSDPNTLGKVAQGIFSFENGGWGDQGQTQAAPNAPQPNGPSGAPPTDVDVAGASTQPVQPTQIGQANSTVGLSPRFQRGLATLAIMSGHPDQAATIMSGDVVPDSSGNLVDHKTGRVLGRVPAASYVNGFRVDPNAPGAPSFVPNLPAGTMPDGRGGVVAIPGAATATRQQKFAETAGANDANWPGDLVSVPMGDGTTRTMSRSQFATMMNGGNGQGAGGTPTGTGSAAGNPGVASPSTSQTEFDKAQAGDASKTLSTDMDCPRLRPSPPERPQPCDALQGGRGELPAQPLARDPELPRDSGRQDQPVRQRRRDLSASVG